MHAEWTKSVDYTNVHSLVLLVYYSWDVTIGESWVNYTEPLHNILYGISLCVCVLYIKFWLQIAFRLELQHQHFPASAAYWLVLHILDLPVWHRVNQLLKINLIYTDITDSISLENPKSDYILIKYRTMYRHTIQNNILETDKCSPLEGQTGRRDGRRMDRRVGVPSLVPNSCLYSFTKCR